ncbi:coiled-coil-helix-coiled-coil-helix domain-containing protein 10, mitochondrial-like [Camellia sinensis]|uniref:CHCH domain-containing protein n=1 Tax=Camellia sinensis var. sinensis TaxID=542762 RepID=A0A4S4F2T4_CAMSN|nr:coiled-coil-helix-coiled-coil-helix domain-containing protein 10, mitochondrial-like [Camellia sinensis]THG23813.1 hypothetical protein TEA_001609 [Camellia sinensis var. sinensis]
MARGSSGGRSGGSSGGGSGGWGWSKSAPSASGGSLRNPQKRDAPARPPAPAPAPAPATAQGESAKGGLGASVADGMAFGGGNAIGHRAADAVIGPRVFRHEVVGSSVPSVAPVSADSDTCGGQSKSFIDCLNYNASDISKCQFYMDMLCECHKGGSVSSA